MWVGGRVSRFLSSGPCPLGRRRAFGRALWLAITGFGRTPASQLGIFARPAKEHELSSHKRAAEEKKSGPNEEAPPEPLFDLRQIVQLIHFNNLIHGFHAFAF